MIPKSEPIDPEILPYQVTLGHLPEKPAVPAKNKILGLGFRVHLNFRPKEAGHPAFMGLNHHHRLTGYPDHFHYPPYRITEMMDSVLNKNKVKGSVGKRQPFSVRKNPQQSRVSFLHVL